MAYYPPEVIEQARKMDLLTYLENHEPDELVHFSRDTYTTRTHDSLKISNGMWYWFSRGFGGRSALEYLIKVKEYSFIEAVETIIGSAASISFKNYNNAEKKEMNKLILPKKADNNDRAKSYLINRGIDEDIIQECIDNDLIYQQYPNNNVVFVGYDDNNVPRYAMSRGTNESRYMQEASGSHKAFSFRLEAINETENLHLFESAIDLLSYATLMKMDNKEWYNETLLSLAGVYQPAKNINESKLPLALNLYLTKHKNIKRIYLHLDNDNVGRLATLALKNIIPKQYEIIDDPSLIGKDINDFLCWKKGINNKKIMKRKGDYYEI